MKCNIIIDTVKQIESHHSSIQTIELIQIVKRKSLTDINVDLIYGLPYQTLEDVYKDINIIDTLDISHVSVYSLILEEHTVLKNRDYQPLSDEQDAFWYVIILTSICVIKGLFTIK